MVAGRFGMRRPPGQESESLGEAPEGETADQAVLVQPSGFFMLPS